MVKGVNKTVIEINDTGSNIFEKVVLFVTPKYSNLSTKRLKIEAKRVVNGFSDAGKVPTVRQKYRRRRILCFIAAGITMAAVAVTAFLILS